MFNISRNTLRLRPLSRHVVRLIHESNKGCKSNAYGTVKFCNTLFKNPSGLIGGLIILFWPAFTHYFILCIKF